MTVRGTTKGRRAPGTPAGLDATQVVGAAVGVVAEHGVDGLSMRRVAQALRVAPNALYGHVADKDALLDHVTDELLGAPADDDDGGWRLRLDALGRQVHAALRDHPALASRLLARGTAGPHHAALRDAAGDAVAHSRLPEARRDAAVSALFALALGTAASGGGDEALQVGLTALLDHLARGTGR